MAELRYLGVDVTTLERDLNTFLELCMSVKTDSEKKINSLLTAAENLTKCDDEFCATMDWIEERSNMREEVDYSKRVSSEEELRLQEVLLSNMPLAKITANETVRCQHLEEIY